MNIFSLVVGYFLGVGSIIFLKYLKVQGLLDSVPLLPRFIFGLGS